MRKLENIIIFRNIIMYVPKKRNYRRKANAGKAKKRYSKRPSGLFKKKVLSVISGQVEDKMAVYSPAPKTLDAGALDSADIIQLLPQIQKGTENNERIGDQIKGKYINIRGHLELNTSQNTADGPTRICCRVVVCTPKNLGAWYEQLSTNAGWLSGMIDYGQSNQAIDGSVGAETTIKSLYLPINRNTATVHHDKLHYLNIPRWFNNTGTQNTNMDWQNTIKFFNINVKCRKVMKYTGTNLYPNNFNPVMLIAYAYLNGGASSNTFVRCHYLSRFQYEEA